MKAMMFMLPQQGSDLHSTLFNKLRELRINDFCPSNPERNRIVFYSNGQFIVARCSAPINSTLLPLIDENLNVEKGSRIKAIVTLNRDRQIMCSKDERVAFIEKHGRLPKSSENHKYIRMSDIQVAEYAPIILERAGLRIIDLKVSPSPITKISMTKRGLHYKPVDVSFEAEIMDLEAFSKAWYEGVGRTKTYGFGMIRAVQI